MTPESQGVSCFMQQEPVETTCPRILVPPALLVLQAQGEVRQAALASVLVASSPGSAEA